VDADILDFTDEGGDKVALASHNMKIIHTLLQTDNHSSTLAPTASKQNLQERDFYRLHSVPIT